MSTLTSNRTSGSAETKSGYAWINGLNMYYRIQGVGKPLVFLPSVFGYAGQVDFPMLEEKRSVITVDLQGWGRTADIDRPWRFENCADDVVALLKYLEIDKADFFGYSLGGLIATLVAVKYPQVVDRVVSYGAMYGNFVESTRAINLETPLSLSPDAFGMTFVREGYKKVAPDPDHWPIIWAKVFGVDWNGFTPTELQSIQAPFLLAVGDNDFIRLDHCLATFDLIPNAELAVIPDAGHFVVFEEPEKLIPVVETFLKSPTERHLLEPPLPDITPASIGDAAADRRHVPVVAVTLSSANKSSVR